MCLILKYFESPKNAFKNFFAHFWHFCPKRIFVSTSTAIFSVICCAREVFVTIFINFRQKSFRIWFQIGSNIFGRGQKMHLKKRFLPIFGTFAQNGFLYQLQLQFSQSFVVLGKFLLPFS